MLAVLLCPFLWLLSLVFHSTMLVAPPYFAPLMPWSYQSPRRDFVSTIAGLCAVSMRPGVKPRTAVRRYAYCAFCHVATNSNEAFRSSVCPTGRAYKGFDNWLVCRLRGWVHHRFAEDSTVCRAVMFPPVPMRQGVITRATPFLSKPLYTARRCVGKNR